MIYSREQYSDYLTRELKGQNEEFLSKVNSLAIRLLETDGEIFLGQYQGVKHGQVILKMRNDRGLPRKGSHLNAMVLPSELRNYHNWDKQTYGDLINHQDCNCELTCVWYNTTEDYRFSLAGFSGVTIEFHERIKDAQGIIFVLGPQIPPTEFLFNLRQIVKDESCEEANEILDSEYIERDWQAKSLTDQTDVSSYIIRQLECSDRAILQGPPGTGKTTVISKICQYLIDQGKSVLVTAMTNRALMKIATKEELTRALNSGKVSKTNLTLDESDEVSRLVPAKEIVPTAGRLQLSTNFISSGTAIKSRPDIGFDYVIIDEGSQTILPMFAAASRLGKKQLWAGDVRQLPPVSVVHERTIQKYNYSGIVDGFKTLSTMSTVPNYQLTATYRLSQRCARYTNYFYNGILKSKSAEQIDCSLPPIFNVKGGPSLITTDMPRSYVSDEARVITLMAVKAIIESHPNANIAVLSCFKETVKHLHRTLLQHGMLGKNVIVETIARVQGLTTDYTIFVIPNTSLIRSLEPRLFNVATSRARRNTLLVADSDILSHCHYETVRNYLSALYSESHLHINRVQREGTFLIE